MLRVMRVFAGVALAASAVGCAAEESDPNCQLGDLVGTCCEPLNAAGQPMTNSAGAALQGVCNGNNLCQFGAAASQVARALACGNPVGGGAQDMGPSITLPDLGGGGGSPVPGGSGGEPVGGSTGGALPGGDGGAGGGAGGSTGGDGGGPGDPCADVRCPEGAACDPATGRCLPIGGGGVHTGPCETAEDCPPGDECVSEEATDGRVPGGFCLFNCRSDNDCGDGQRCLASGQTNICFAVCNGAGDCRDGWVCVDPGDGSGDICQPDCRVGGCGAGEVCNAETGLCDVGCPYACAAGESCEGGHCVRLNGSCATDYHCPVDTHQCFEGSCVPVQGTDCFEDPATCGASQLCFENGPAQSLCLFGCGVDEDCPFNEVCYPDINVCWFRFCGNPEQPNGEVLGTCATGSQNQWEGTCFPLAVGDPAGGSEPGMCLEAGQANEGQPCNAQAEGRDANSRAVQCAPGFFCFGDPDDPLDPALDFASTGECAGLCNPQSARCSAGRTCVDFSNPDDPNTPDFDETRVLGMCLEVDCTLGTGGASGCGAGQVCRPLSLFADEGQCEPAGNVAPGGPCVSQDDCAEESFCGDPGSGSVCIPTCNVGSPSCPEGTMCVNNGWGFALCL